MKLHSFSLIVLTITIQWGQAQPTSPACPPTAEHRFKQIKFTDQNSGVSRNKPGLPGLSVKIINSNGGILFGGYTDESGFGCIPYPPNWQDWDWQGASLVCYDDGKPVITIPLRKIIDGEGMVVVPVKPKSPEMISNSPKAKDDLEDALDRIAYLLEESGRYQNQLDIKNQQIIDLENEKKQLEEANAWLRGEVKAAEIRNRELFTRYKKIEVQMDSLKRENLRFLKEIGNLNAQIIDLRRINTRYQECEKIEAFVNQLPQIEPKGFFWTPKRIKNGNFEEYWNTNKLEEFRAIELSFETRSADASMRSGYYGRASLIRGYGPDSRVIDLERWQGNEIMEVNYGGGGVKIYIPIKNFVQDSDADPVTFVIFKLYFKSELFDADPLLAVCTYRVENGRFDLPRPLVKIIDLEQYKCLRN